MSSTRRQERKKRGVRRLDDEGACEWVARAGARDVTSKVEGWAPTVCRDDQVDKNERTWRGGNEIRIDLSHPFQM